LLGVDRLLLISSPEFDVEKRVAQHRNVIGAAAALGVKLVAYTSFIGADTPRPSFFNAHYSTERALEQSGRRRRLHLWPLIFGDAFASPHPHVIGERAETHRARIGIVARFRLLRHWCAY
jgi:NAD(P)H dehydrogenase (quinone)